MYIFKYRINVKQLTTPHDLWISWVFPPLVSPELTPEELTHLEGRPGSQRFKVDSFPGAAVGAGCWLSPSVLLQDSLRVSISRRRGKLQGSQNVTSAIVLS